MQKEVQELKGISKIIDNGVYNIALAKAVQGVVHMGDEEFRKNLGSVRLKRVSHSLF